LGVNPYGPEVALEVFVKLSGNLQQRDFVMNSGSSSNKCTDASLSNTSSIWNSRTIPRIR
jgi:hypothetical protein